MTSTRTSFGHVTAYDRENGVGEIESAATPGGCFLHFTNLESDRPDGYREIAVGTRVQFSYEEAEQDGYHYRAIAVHRLPASD